jgi:Trypsin
MQYRLFGVTYSDREKSFIIFSTVGLDCVIAGWGTINKAHQIRPQKLQSLQVAIGDWNMCKRQRPRTFQNFHICAGIQRVLSKTTCDVIKLLQ